MSIRNTCNLNSSDPTAHTSWRCGNQCKQNTLTSCLLRHCLHLHSASKICQGFAGDIEKMISYCQLNNIRDKKEGKTPSLHASTSTNGWHGTWFIIKLSQSTSKLADANYITLFTPDKVKIFDEITANKLILGKVVLQGWMWHYYDNVFYHKWICNHPMYHQKFECTRTSMAFMITKKCHLHCLYVEHNVSLDQKKELCLAHILWTHGTLACPQITTDATRFCQRNKFGMLLWHSHFQTQRITIPAITMADAIANAAHTLPED